MRVGIVDYGVGNLGSAARAIDELRVSVVLLDRPSDIQTVDCLILPGVGSYTECKSLLDLAGWTEALREAVLDREMPLLGICLGMQLLADSGFEGAVGSEPTPGLGLIPGQVRSLESIGCELRSPHMGWNSINWGANSSLMRNIPNGTDFYFVHGYVFVPTDQGSVIAFVDYGKSVPAVVGKGRVWGTQFHPEKSSRAGLCLLRNFIEGAVC